MRTLFVTVADDVSFDAVALALGEAGICANVEERDESETLILNARDVSPALVAARFAEILGGK